MPTILVVEDEPAIADTLTFSLQQSGFTVQWVSLGQEAIARFISGSIDLIILDVGLPDVSGFEVCKIIRQSSNIPIIFLTARSEEIDRVIGFEIGGDDYVAKPFSPRELVSRVKAVLKRVSPPEASLRLNEAVTTDGMFQLDSDKASITYHNHALELTRYEFLIMQLLLSQSERVFSRSDIMNAVWDAPDHSMDRTVDTHIKSIRAKLRKVDDTLDPIKTHRGMGYSIINTSLADL